LASVCDLYSLPGNDLTDRFPMIIEVLARLQRRFCIIDGETVSCGDDGIAGFERMRDWRHGDGVFPWAFDLIELNGDDLRCDPLAVRKATPLRTDSSGLRVRSVRYRLGPPRNDLPAMAISPGALVSTILGASQGPPDLLTSPESTWLRSIPTVTVPPVIISRTHEAS
jgi:hypothetical protein